VPDYPPVDLTDYAVQSLPDLSDVVFEMELHEARACDWCDRA
jgi:hypothetical protein